MDNKTVELDYLSRKKQENNNALPFTLIFFDKNHFFGGRGSVVLMCFGGRQGCGS